MSCFLAIFSVISLVHFLQLKWELKENGQFVSMKTVPDSNNSPICHLSFHSFPELSSFPSFFVWPLDTLLVMVRQSVGKEWAFPESSYIHLPGWHLADMLLSVTRLQKHISTSSWQTKGLIKAKSFVTQITLQVPCIWSLLLTTPNMDLRGHSRYFWTEIFSIKHIVLFCYWKVMTVKFSYKIQWGFIDVQHI